MLCVHTLSCNDPLELQKSLFLGQGLYRGGGRPVPDHPPTCKVPLWITERNCKNDF